MRITAPLLLMIAWQTQLLAAEETIDYAAKIQPLLAKNCFACHGVDEQEGGLALHRRERAMATLESEAMAIVAHRPESSELLRRVESSDDDVRMPPEGEPLSPAETDLLRRWIKQGAQYSTHWAYRPLSTGSAPVTRNDAWVRNPIDTYVLARLEQANIEPSPEANRHQLIKRLYYDLIGLTPSIQDVDRFVADDSPDAYERLVDRLLPSQHFGERWGRHWLDMARFADSDGYEKDNPRPDAWRYRDWVIRAWNDDLPFDQFTVRQLAGDLLPDRSPASHLATAFHRQTLTNTEGGTDQEQWRVAAVMDRTETLGQVWLGLSVGCARCHSHKYDQITQQEYYQLFAYFNNGDETSAEVDRSPAQRAKYERQRAEHERQLAELQSRIEEEAEDGRKARLSQELAELKKLAPQPPRISVRVISQRTKTPRKTHVLRRGEFKQPMEKVRPQVLDCLAFASPNQRSGDRLELARWLVGGRNPLTPRVVVNQIWMHLFGEGIVRTINDFGVRGEPPSHPRLLDWLAGEFVAQGWSRKAVIKLIVLSATYRQSSRTRPALAEIDPSNRLLHRQNRFRAEAEIVRDLTLSASGLLSRKVGGPSVFPKLASEVAAVSYANNFKWRTSAGEDRFRRGIYTFFKRTAPHPNLTTFDCPDSNVACVQRSRSNTPLAALILLNNITFVEAAQALAQRASHEDLPDDDARLRFAFRCCLTRWPTLAEEEQLLRLLSDARTWYDTHPDDAAKLTGQYAVKGVSARETAAWTATVRVLLNLDEFITRD